MKWISILKKKYKTFFEISENSDRDTFAKELNYEAGKLFFVVFLTPLINLLYIPVDLMKHRFPVLAVTIHLTFILLSIVLIALRFTRKFNNRPVLLLKTLAAFFYIAASALAALSGSMTAVYTGVFAAVLIIPVFAPFSLKFKITGTVLSLAVFFLMAPMGRADFSVLEIGYSAIDLIIISILAIILSHSQNRMRYRAWEQSMELKQALLETGQRDDLLNSAVSRLEAVINNHPGITFYIEKDQSIVLFNGIYLKNLGYDPGYFSGKNIDILKEEPFSLDMVSGIRKTFTEGPQEWMFENKDKTFHAHSMPVYDPNLETVNVVGSIDDITDIVKLQRELEKTIKMANDANIAKGNFLARMSHEIRTPMNAVIGMAELALREKEPDAILRHIYTIKQAGANLLSIINDILDFSKIESGKLEINPAYYRLPSLINDVISIIRMRAIDSRLRFVVNIDSNIPDELYGDEARIRQSMINILGNAVKYTDEGFVSFCIMGEIINEDTINLTIDIMDSGRGIKKEDISGLFKDFGQVNTAENRGVEGTGLGLAITWNIIKAMDGNIEVFSEYGKGSTFIVTFPQKFRASQKVASVEDPEDKSVIVYERRDIYANSIVCTVDNLGVFCALASDEDDFREKLAEKKYPFIFIASALYEKSKKTIKEYGAMSKTVLLTEFGEAILGNGLSILAMPAHSISISNILNGVAESYPYKENIEAFAGFTAPEAKVLIVDDIKTNLKVAEGLLLPYKMEVDLCRSGMEAIRAVQKKHYDLVFMDHRMPEMDGVEAVDRIRKLDDDFYREMPIIALTANAIAGTEEMFLAAGFDGFLAKPIDTIKLAAILEKWIPAEKHGSPQNSEAAAEEQTPPEDFAIEGVDIDRGIQLIGSSVERYMQTLAIYHADGSSKINDLEKCLETDNMELFTIHIHALKSASANIGAGKISDAAKELEAAAGRGDKGFINEHIREFLTSLEKLLNNISKKLPALDADTEQKTDQAEKGILKSKLAKLRTAIEFLDTGVIQRTIRELQDLKLAENEYAAIRNISESILMADYNNALEQIKTLQ